MLPAGAAPLLDAYYRDRADVTASFAIPGHKNRYDLIGNVTVGDRPVLLTHDMHAPSQGTVRVAEHAAADLWGATHARFSVNGSSAANQAAVMAVAGPGDTVIVSRTLHKSLLLGLVHAGATPVWIRPTLHPDTGLPIGMDPAVIGAALTAHPDARAVIVGEPSYVGTHGDVRAMATVAHTHNVPLIVDAAWAAHYGFHPALPAHALHDGADIMVTSTHKTLPAWTQSAMILTQGDRVDQGRLDKMFNGTQTTSPSAAILASIDGARALLHLHGPDLLGPVITAVAHARAVLARIPDLIVLDGPGVDPLKLVLLLPGTGATGYAIASELLGHGIDLETIDRDILIPQITLADTPDGIAAMVTVLSAAIRRHARRARRGLSAAAWQVEPTVVMSPRDAFYATTVTVPWSAALGRVSAELIAPYPPGIPVLAPGELITAAALELLTDAQAAGVTIAYAADPTLATVRVVA